MHHFRVLPLPCITAMFACLVLAGAAPADVGRKTFDDLYGPRVKAVKATRERTDDVELARELLATAKKDDVDESICTVFCEEAYALTATTPEGYEVAADAMAILARRSTKLAVSARDRQVEVLMRQLRTSDSELAGRAMERLIELHTTSGDEHVAAGRYAPGIQEFRKAMLVARGKGPAAEAIKARLDRAVAGEKVERQIATLREKLLANAGDSASAEELIRLYIVELNDPKSAAMFIDRARNEPLKAMTLAAGKPMSELDEVAALALGEWYRELSQKASVTGRHAMLSRSREYLSHYLTLHTARDATHTRASLFLDQINAELAKQPGAAIATGGAAAKTPIAAPVGVDPPASGDNPNAMSAKDLDGTGMLGRLTVNGKDLATAFHYAPGAAFQHKVVETEVLNAGEAMKGVSITLLGYVRVAKATPVKIWHAGGSASGGVLRLYIDDKEVGSVGDDRVKNTVHEFTLQPGVRNIKWRLSGGHMGTCVLQFFDAQTMQPLEISSTKNDLVVKGAPPLKKLLRNSDAGARVGKPKELAG